MNIFVTSPDPYECAQALDDKRVGKMLLEATQMLATVLILRRVAEEFIPHTVKGNVYKLAHPNHPCSKWVQEHRSNFRWLLHHARGLSLVHLDIYNREHACGAEIRKMYHWLDAFIATEIFCDCTSLPPSNDSIFDRYKECLRRKWATEKPTWTNRPEPEWR